MRACLIAVFMLFVSPDVMWLVAALVVVIALSAILSAWVEAREM